MNTRNMYIRARDQDFYAKLSHGWHKQVRENLALQQTEILRFHMTLPWMEHEQHSHFPDSF